MIPFSILLVIFFAFMGLVLLFTFFNIYHMLRYGKAGLTTPLVTIAYVVVIFFMITMSVRNILNIDWTERVDFFPSVSSPYVVF
ncbi:hypothetical protein HYV72_02035 [Candidatus Uhrbacteria bacterium]|nr:hypothetical protein [Candidatus Uhrbacteria bacterium]